MAKRINRDDVDKLHDYGIHIPSRTVYLETSTSDAGEEKGACYELLQRVSKNLHVLDAASDADIQLVINCEGGDEVQGMGVFDCIRACRSRVIGTVTGQAASMGCVILQACDVRQATPSAFIMYHSGVTNGDVAPYHEARQMYQWTHRYGDEVIDRRVWDRVRERKPTITFKRFQRVVERGLYLTPVEAIEWGLLDAVAEPAG